MPGVLVGVPGVPVGVSVGVPVGVHGSGSWGGGWCGGAWGGRAWGGACGAGGVWGGLYCHDMPHRVRMLLPMQRCIYTYVCDCTQVCQLVFVVKKFRRNKQKKMGEEHREYFGALLGPDELTIYKNTFTETAAEEFAKNELASEQLTSEQLGEKAVWTVLYVSRLVGLRCSAQSCRYFALCYVLMCSVRLKRLSAKHF